MKNQKNKCIFSISTNHDKIIQIRSKYLELNQEDKIIVLGELREWVRQEINNLYPEQE
jgi:hypothetical protein